MPLPASPSSARVAAVPKPGDAGSVRVPELDGLRGVGALLLVAYHVWPNAVFFGWTRVDLFFVLSGYLITSILLRNPIRPRFLWIFWVRRALRIWPAYFLLLAVICVSGWLTGAPPQTDAVAAHLSFTQNLPIYWSGEVPPFPHAVQTWSLAIEEQFYVLWPLVVALAGRSLIVPVALWVTLNAVVLRAFGLYPTVALARCDGLTLGSILAVALRDRDRVKANLRGISLVVGSLGIAAFGLLLGPLARLEPPIPGLTGCGTLSILAINLGYASLIGMTILYSGHSWLAPLRIGVLRYMGRISYGLFLDNVIILNAISDHVGIRTIVTDIATVLACILAAAISFHCLEQPIGNLKDRYPYPSSIRRPRASLNVNRTLK